MDHVPTVLPCHSVLKDVFSFPNGNILDETQRLIEEAQLKLRSMEDGINHETNFTIPNVYPSSDEHHLSSKDLKNQQLKQALDNKLKKLEKQLDTHWKKQSEIIGLPDASVNASRSLSTAQVQSNKHAQRGHARHLCRKLSEADQGPQDVVDVVRTARDSVQGALVAARKLSASLDNRTPRTSHHSASGIVNNTQLAESDSAHLCVEHGTKRKMCSCLRHKADDQGLKPEENRTLGAEEKVSYMAKKLASTKSNVGIFEAKSTCHSKKDGRPPSKRLEMSVMPSVSIKRSLEKQMMPLIEVPSPGSSPDDDKRENTGVRNFKHADPQESAQTQRNCCKISSLEERRALEPNDMVPETITSCSAIVPRPSATQELLDLDNTELKQVLEFLLNKISSPQVDAARDNQSPSCVQDQKLDRCDVPRSSRHVLEDDSDESHDIGGSIAYNSLSLFLQTYSKAAVESKRSKQKAAERRKEEEQAMRAQEQRFKNSSSNNQQSEVDFIGPFGRTIFRENVRKNNSLPAASPSIQKGKEDSCPIFTPRPDSVEELNSKNENRLKLNESHAKEPEALKSFPDLKSNQFMEIKHPKSDFDEKISISLKPNADAPIPDPGPAHEPLQSSVETEDEYEDDWEEDNDGENYVETRDVGDGSERETHDELTDGLAHTLRTIVEVEENSSLSVSLIHHEPVSQPTESGANKSESQPVSFTEAKTLPSSQFENKVQLGDTSVIKVSHRTVVGKELPQEEVESAAGETVAPLDKLRTDKSEEFSSSRAFLEMTEALKKMLESVVSTLTQNKPSDETVFRNENLRRSGTSAKRRGFESRHFTDRRSGDWRYDPTSSGSANDDRVSSGSETPYSCSRSIKWNTKVNKGSGNRVRFKTISQRSSATQTDIDDLKQDAETQVTPDKKNEQIIHQGWQMQDDLYLRPSKISLERTTWRAPSRPISLSLDMDPTARLLAIQRSLSSYQIQGFPAVRAGGGGNGVNFLPDLQSRGSVSQCNSLSSSSSSILPTDGLEYPANNTIMSLSEGEVLAYHSCSCSEGEMCLCVGKCGKSRNNYDVCELSGRVFNEPVVGGSAPFTQNFYSILDSTASEKLMDLSDHFSEGEVIERLKGI